MTGADLYYRAFRAFKNEEAEHHLREREKIKEAIIDARSASDISEYSFYELIIESDWIDAVEEGLDHVEKAIEAQRRFIRYEGETVRIEKAKRTSVESVKHLARHSDLIKEERDDSVMPEKLYVVENEENFAVYENRFIFTLLTMLSDFVAVRYNAMTDARTQARYTLATERSITAAGRKISFNISFDERSARLDAERSASEDALYMRVGALLTRIVGYLDTPLMRIVSQAPLLNPPIVRTNVLKMDPHFFAAFELYTYILAYDKDGYSVIEHKECAERFDDDMCELICDSVLFAANIAYIGNDTLRGFLSGIYDEEESRRIMQRDKERAHILKEASRKLESGESDILSYAKELLNLSEEVRKDLFNIRGSYMNLKNQHDKLFRENERRVLECERLRKENLAHISRINELETSIDDAVKETRADFTRQLEEQARDFGKEKKELMSSLEKSEEALVAIRAEYEERIKNLTVEYDARVRALRLAEGVGLDEDNSVFREDFIRLEAEKAAFDAYYKKQWSMAKKNIRKTLLHNKKDTHSRENAEDVSKNRDGNDKEKLT